MTRITGGYSTLAVNIPDFSRFSKDRHAHYWQIPTIPLLKSLLNALMSIISVPVAEQIWGTPSWTLIHIIDKRQDTPSGRAAANF
jgi:NCS1 family nucleobase:cation symporter-1